MGIFIKRNHLITIMQVSYTQKKWITFYHEKYGFH